MVICRAGERVSHEVLVVGAEAGIHKVVEEEGQFPVPGCLVCAAIKEDALDRLLHGRWWVLQRRHPLLPVEDALSICTATVSAVSFEAIPTQQAT